MARSPIVDVLVKNAKAQNKRSKRIKDDAYETPPWCVKRLLENEDFYSQWMNSVSGPVLEPCAGQGNIIRTVDSYDLCMASAGWVATELRPECSGALEEACPRPASEEVGPSTVKIGDFFSQETQAFVRAHRPTCAITNPPYSLAVPFIESCLTLVDGVVAMLLRLNFGSSAKREKFFSGKMPDIYVLPDRPNFVLSDLGSTSDMQEYAWFVWPEREERARYKGTWNRLGITPRSERPKPTK